MNRSVQLFITCLLDTLYPEVGEAVVQVLRRAGAQVDFPSGQTCCGQPAFNAGLRAEARQVAMHTIQVFDSAPGLVVAPSGSCVAMFRHGYPELFRDDPAWLPRAQSLAGRTYEFSEFLVDHLGIVDLGARFPARLAYHASCHLLRELKIDRQPKALLAAVQGAEILELPGERECCGFGGVFSVEHPQISSAMLERKIANFQASGAEWVVSCDAGCITQINGGMHRRGQPPRALHLAQVLAHF
jgi:L-lactate dehydrogenase complex protein LldE